MLYDYIFFMKKKTTSKMKFGLVTSKKTDYVVLLPYYKFFDERVKL